MRALDCVSTNKMSPTESTEVFTVKMSSSYDLNEPSRDVESQSRRRACGYRHLWWTLGLDFPIVLIAASLIALFELGVIPCHKSGFYCQDPALSFPYVGETVSTAVLIVTILLGPVVILLSTEYIFAEESVGSPKLFNALKKFCWVYRAYTYGLVMNLGVVEVMKGIVGNPRPTFFYICEPDTGKICNGSEYVSSFECTSTKFSWWEQLDSYRSFPSGHTSMSVYCGVFIAWYLQKRAFNWRHRTILLVPALQLLSISFSVTSSLTRITDSRHHWWDVLAGTGVAFLALFYTIIFLCNNFSYASEKSEQKSASSLNTTQSLLFEDQRVVT